MIESLRNYILIYENIEKNAKMNVEYLSSDPVNYSLMEEPLSDFGKGVGVLKRYGNGILLKEFRARLLRTTFYEEPIKTNIDNSRFIKEFEKWIKSNNKNKIYPDIKGILGIETTTNGYIESIANDQTHAVYTVGLKITYLEKE